MDDDNVITMVESDGTVLQSDGKSAPIELVEEQNSDSDEIEVTTEWLESLFVKTQSELLQSQNLMMDVLQMIASNQSTMIAALESLSIKLPENLTVLLTTQQESITSLVAQSMETVQTLLIPQVQQVEPAMELQNDVVENPVLKTESTEPLKPKRRLI